MNERMGGHCFEAPPGVVVPDPMQNFADGGWPAPLMDAITRAGYDKPTPIQAQSWPIALQGYDIISVAKTGSGKTVGYLFPASCTFKPAPKARGRWDPL